MRKSYPSKTNMMATIDENGLWHGKLGNDVYYVLQGKQMKRRAPKLRKGPKTAGMKRMALFTDEFGKASSAGKHLRKALESACSFVQDPHLYQRVNSLMVKLKNCHQSPLGTRTSTAGLCTEEGKAVFDSFRFQLNKENNPRILSTIHKTGKVTLTIQNCKRANFILTELQINLVNGRFRTHVHSLPFPLDNKQFVIKKKYRSTIGFTDFLMISGHNFLQGVVLKKAKENNKKHNQ